MYEAMLIAYLSLNVPLSLGVTALFVTLGLILLKATLKCQQQVPIAVSRVIGLIYGAFTLGVVGLNIPNRIPLSIGQAIETVGRSAGANLIALSVIALIGMIVLLITAQRVLDVMTYVDRQQRQLDPA